MIKKPRMILFDYGQTLISETPYDFDKSFNAVLKRAVSNPDNITAEILKRKFLDLRKAANVTEELSVEPCIRYLFRYLREYFNLKFDVSDEMIERIFWDESVEFNATEGINDFLKALDKHGIRTAVISNLDYTEGTLLRILEKYLDYDNFEFVISTCEYQFRKPFKYIFELALKKANLNADEAVYCGNDVRYDIYGASGAGILPVLYKGSPYFKEQEKPNCKHLSINNWKELEKILFEN